jgi:two-component SAPR family response regulator
MILIVENDVARAMTLWWELERAGGLVGGLATTAAEAWQLAATVQPDFAFITVNPDSHVDEINLAHDLRDHYGTMCIFLSIQRAGARICRDASFKVIEVPFDPASAVLAIDIAAAARICHQFSPIKRKLLH